MFFLFFLSGSFVQVQSFFYIRYMYKYYIITQAFCELLKPKLITKNKNKVKTYIKKNHMVNANMHATVNIIRQKSEHV